MRLHNHIAYRFLTDEKLLAEFMEARLGRNWDNLPVEKFAFLFDLLSPRNIDGATPHKVYYCTKTITDKLELLKVKRKQDGEFDWTVFNSIPQCKKTLIFEKNNLFRIYVRASSLVIAHLTFSFDSGSKLFGTTLITIFAVDRETGECSEAFKTDPNIHKLDELAYKLLCFYFLSETTEEILKPGQKRGTQRTGKIINELPVPITIVDSKWNITSIRTEGFEVCGHFRLQPFGPGLKQTRVIFIEPFEKHGYKRHAKKLQHE